MILDLTILPIFLPKTAERVGMRVIDLSVCRVNMGLNKFGTSTHVPLIPEHHHFVSTGSTLGLNMQG